MRVLICGDRDWKDFELISKELDSLVLNNLDEEIVVIEGNARGADKMAGQIAKREGFLLEIYPAQWDLYGKAAGPVRNQQMLMEGKPDLVLAFHDDIANSKGTFDMITRAKRAGIPCHLISHGKDSVVKEIV